MFLFKITFVSGTILGFGMWNFYTRKVFYNCFLPICERSVQSIEDRTAFKLHINFVAKKEHMLPYIKFIC